MKLYSLIIAATCFLTASLAHASVTVTVNGSNHTIPQTNEKGWGTNVTAWIQAISQFTLQNSGGTFSLTADANFGSSYGLVSSYYKSRSSNIATSGVLRLANTDSIGFRNAANGGNLLLAVDSSDNLTFNGVIVPTATASDVQDSTFRIYDNGDATKKIAFQASGITTATTRTITMPDSDVDLGGLVNANIASGAAIVDTKLDTIATAGKVSNSATTATSSNTNSAIVARDGSGNFSAGTITANLTGAVTGNASTATALAANPSDCAADTYANAIAASGNLTCSTVTNAGLAGSIAASKLVGSDIATVGTITSGTWNGTTIAIANGGTGATSKSTAFDALSPMTSSGDIIYGGASGTGTRLAKGSDGQVLTLASGLPSWGSALTNPMNTGGDIIYGGASGTPTRLANGSAGQVLTSAGGTSAPTWTSSGSLVLLSTQTASSSASIEFTSGIDSTYNAYLITITHYVPQTNSTTIDATMSTNNGSSYASANYHWTRNSSAEAGAFSGAGSASDSNIKLNGTGNGTGEGVNYECVLHNPASTTRYKTISCNVGGYSAGVNFIGRTGGTYAGATTAINAIKFTPSSGNITSGVFKLYGIR